MLLLLVWGHLGVAMVVVVVLVFQRRALRRSRALGAGTAIPSCRRARYCPESAAVLWKNVGFGGNVWAEKGPRLLPKLSDG